MTATIDMADAERETLIQDCQSNLQNVELSSDEKREIWQKMKTLINGRSAERVKVMEIEKGIVDPEGCG